MSTTLTGTILDRIVDQKRFRLEQRQNLLSFQALRQKVEALVDQAGDAALPPRRWAPVFSFAPW